ncbi:MAG: serine/threonine-protein kinase [Thermoguttaceae bacterium]
MSHSVVAVEVQESEQDQERTAPARAASAGTGSRFTYPSGSRPLDGYTIKRGVGHGGFGEVYYATSDAGKEVALKLIRRNLDVELRGIRHCLNLKHPNLLSIFDIREDAQGDNWVVMEFVAGQSLEEVVVANPVGIPVERALFWIHGIGAGVSHLHDHGVVHRDLKPGNIFNDQGIVKIGDYGLSKFISCSRRSGQTESIGTVHYMAPEVANGRYGKEIDVYALGVVLYEMLTGRVPFEGESVGEVLMKHLTATPDVSMLAEPYRTVVARALEKDPGRRYSSAGEMLAQLPKPRLGHDYGPVPGAASTTSYDPRANRSKTPHETPRAAGSQTEEPIFRALRDGYQDVRRNWNHSNLNTPTKIGLLCALLLAAPFLFSTFSGLAIFLVALYCVYWILRALILTVKEPAPVGSFPFPSPGQAAPPRPAAPVVAPPPAARPVPSRQSRLPRWARHEKPVAAMLVKPFRQRLTELVGSLLAGAVIAILTCILGFLLASLRSDAVLEADDLARCAWVILASVAGTWAVLIPAKFWEGCKGDVKLRRCAMMLAGLLVGLAAAVLSIGLLVDLPPQNVLPNLDLHDLTGLTPVRLNPADVRSDLRYYLVAFGALFLMLRWWRSADPMRTSRLSLVSVFVSGLAALIISDALGFPKPWLVMVACAMSVSVQLATPWIHPRLRASQDEFD